MAQPANKASEIRNLQSLLMGRDINRCIEADVCVSCGRPAIDFENETSKREFGISGLCQQCQEVAFQPPDEDD